MQMRITSSAVISGHILRALFRSSICRRFGGGYSKERADFRPHRRVPSRPAGFAGAQAHLRPGFSAASSAGNKSSRIAASSDERRLIKSRVASRPVSSSTSAAWLGTSSRKAVSWSSSSRRSSTSAMSAGCWTLSSALSGSGSVNGAHPAPAAQAHQLLSASMCSLVASMYLDHADRGGSILPSPQP